MTLVAGFRCTDGFVIAADTEITHGSVNYQNCKLKDYCTSAHGITLVIGGAGDVSYFTMAAQKICDAVATLPDTPLPSLRDIRAVIDATILEIHSNYIFKFWDPDADTRPGFDLIIGVHAGKNGWRVLRSDDVALVDVDACDFIGSGSALAHHVAERVLGMGLSTAVTANLAGQIFRELKGKGVGVGGNTEILARRTTMNAEPFFDPTLKDYRFMWGLEEILLSATRNALDKNANAQQIDQKVDLIRERLHSIREDVDKPRNAVGDQIHIIEFDTEYGNPTKDLQRS